jgi:ribonuclease P protein component
MKITTITSNRDYQRIYRRGRSFVSPALVTYAFKTKNNNLRIGITTSKKVGKAVRRNRSRRLIRAAFSHLPVDMNQNYDIIFVARTKTCFLKSYEVERYMRAHLCSLGIMRSS